MSKRKTERLLGLVVCLLSTTRYLTAEQIRQAVPGYPEQDELFKRMFERDKEDLRDLGVPLEQVPGIALRYVLSAPEVSTVIPGMRTVRNVERNAAVSDGRALTDEQLATLAKHVWERNFYLAD